MKIIDFTYKKIEIAGALGRLSNAFIGLSDFLLKDVAKQSYWIGCNRKSNGKHNLFIVKDPLRLPDDIVAMQVIRVYPKDIQKIADEWMERMSVEVSAMNPNELRYVARSFLPKEEWWFAMLEQGGRYIGVKSQNVPSAKCIRQKQMFIFHSDVDEKLKEYENQQLTELGLTNNVERIQEGSIVYCSDGDGTHTAVLINLYESTADVLFLTSNPHWNHSSRIVWDDEIKFFGMPVKKETYFAPVSHYPLDETYSSDILYPSDRLLLLKIEFKERFK